MLPTDKMNRPNNLALGLMELGNAFNNQTALTTKRLTALILQLEKRFPGFTEGYNKQVFTIDIANIAGAIEQARRDGGDNALTIISDNTDALKGLKKGAKDKDEKYLEEAGALDLYDEQKPTWLAAYNEGIKDAKAYGERLDKEMEEQANGTSLCKNSGEQS